MRKKTNSEAGFTLVEMLAVTVVLMLLGLMLMAGLGMALNSYRDVTAQSEVDLLLSTAMDALVDDLRFARDVEGMDGVTNGFTYTSDSFGFGTQLAVGGKNSSYEGQIFANGMRVLSTGAYGVMRADGTRAYKVEKMEITPDKDSNTFKIELTIQATADRRIEASGTVTVRCLNKMTDLIETP